MENNHEISEEMNDDNHTFLEEHLDQQDDNSESDVGHSDDSELTEALRQKIKLTRDAILKRAINGRYMASLYKHIVDGTLAKAFSSVQDGDELALLQLKESTGFTIVASPVLELVSMNDDERNAMDKETLKKKCLQCLKAQSVYDNAITPLIESHNSEISEFVIDYLTTQNGDGNMGCTREHIEEVKKILSEIDDSDHSEEIKSVNLLNAWLYEEGDKVLRRDKFKRQGLPIIVGFAGVVFGVIIGLGIIGGIIAGVICYGVCRASL
jgi:hypothetical protein